MATMAQVEQLGDIQPSLFLGFTCQRLLQAVAGRDHATHQGVPLVRVVGLGAAALLHPHAAILRQTNEMYGMRCHTQHAHHSTLYRRHALALRGADGNLLIPPGTAAPLLAQQLCQRIQTKAGIRGCQAPGIAQPWCFFLRQRNALPSQEIDPHPFQETLCDRAYDLPVPKQGHARLIRRALCRISEFFQPIHALSSLLHTIKMVDPVVRRASNAS